MLANRWSLIVDSAVPPLLIALLITYPKTALIRPSRPLFSQLILFFDTRQKPRLLRFVKGISQPGASSIKSGQCVSDFSRRPLSEFLQNSVFLHCVTCVAIVMLGPRPVYSRPSH